MPITEAEHIVFTMSGTGNTTNGENGGIGLKPLQGYHSQQNGTLVIANPLAGKKLNKKCLELVTKASTVKKVRRGVKESVKAIRKKEKGLMIIAANITPLDVISHLPGYCEEHEIPYVWISSKEELGTASQTKRPTSCLLIINPAADAPYKAYFDKVVGLVKEITPSVWTE